MLLIPQTILSQLFGLLHLHFLLTSVLFVPQNITRNSLLCFNVWFFANNNIQHVCAIIQTHKHTHLMLANKTGFHLRYK